MIPSFGNRHKYDVKEEYRQAGLEMSPAMASMSDKQIKTLWNGIGASGHWYNWLIPVTCGLLDVSLCSADHDISYEKGITEEDKAAADLRFKNNMVTWIRLYTDSESRWLLKWRLQRARENYWFVKTMGGAAFWNNKEKPI